MELPIIVFGQPLKEIMAPIGSADFQSMSLDNWQQLNERIVRDFGNTEMAFGKIVDGSKIAETFTIGRTTIVVLVVQREYVDVPICLSFLKTGKGVYLRRYFYDSQQSCDMYMKLATVTLRK